MSSSRDTKNEHSVADVIPIARERQSFLVNLNLYEADPTLAKFLNVFEMAISRTEEMARLHKSLCKHAISHSISIDNIKRLQSLIATFSFKNTFKLKGAQSPQASLGDTSALDKNDSENRTAPLHSSDGKGKSGQFGFISEEEAYQKIEEIGRMGRELEEHKKELLHESNPYFIFVPALEIEQYLRQDFDDTNDPAHKIADYARAAFSHPSNGLPGANVSTVEVDSQTMACLFQLFKNINSDFLTEILSDESSQLSVWTAGLQSAFLYLIKAPRPISTNDQNDDQEQVDDEEELSSSDYWLIRTLTHAYALTQELFDCVIEHQFNSDEHRACSPAIFYLLCQFPFAVPYGSLEDYQAGTDESNVDDLSDGEWKKRWHSLPIMRWNRSLDLFQEKVSIYDQAGQAVRVLGYPHLLRKYSNYRKCNGGYSPLEVEHTADLLGLVQMYASSVNSDPILMIGGLYQSGFERDSEGLGCSWLFDETKNVLPERLAKRATLYMAITERAFADGTDEFAAALLGFFLYSQSLFGEGGLYVDVSRLSALIRRGLQGPGRDLLENCLNVAVQKLKQAKAPLELMLLSSYLKPRPVLVSINSAPKKIEPLPSDRAILQASLRSKFPLVFERFGEKSCALLIEAELLWVRMASEFGSGMREWGPLGIALTKPLEVELVTRLRHVYTSPGYRQYTERSGGKIASKVTLGNIVYMLEMHDKLPKSVVASISHAGITLPVDGKLLSALGKVRNSRNNAAHSDPFTEEHYLGLRKTLFGDGGLSTLAAALKPTR